VRRLNNQWRGRDAATNVLSFPASGYRPVNDMPVMLGDIVLAWETVTGEAELENMTLDHHLSHLIIHGLLHLLHYDHQNEDDDPHFHDEQNIVEFDDPFHGRRGCLLEPHLPGLGAPLGQFSGERLTGKKRSARHKRQHKLSYINKHSTRPNDAKIFGI